jgi:hypothetical protein
VTVARGIAPNSKSTMRHGPVAAAGALFQPVMALPYYWDTNPGMIRQASHALAQGLADR